MNEGVEPNALVRNVWRASVCFCMGALPFGAGACCKEGAAESAPEPTVQSAAASEPAAPPATTTAEVPPEPPNPELPTATIAAPPSRYGTPRRGIVRASPSFRGEEVERLDNGTVVRILRKKPGGWLNVRWDAGSGVSEGWIHTDVVKE